MPYFSNLSRRKFIWGMSCSCGSALLLPSCTDVAMSERKQIRIFSDDYLYSKTFPAYEKFKSKNIQVKFGTVPYNINGTRKIESLDIADASHTPYKKTDTISCDQILMSGGWSPIVHLLSQRGVRPIWNAENLCFLPDGTNENITIIGSAHNQKEIHRKISQNCKCRCL